MPTNLVHMRGPRGGILAAMRFISKNESHHDMKKHPNKHIREAIEYAEENGWKLVGASGHAHIWGKLLCPLQSREGCSFNIHSTPRNPEAHAKRIRSAVDNRGHTED